MPIRRHLLCGCSAAHLDDHGAVFDGVGHASDPGEGCHGEGGDRFDSVLVRVVAFGGPVALVSGVEEAAEVFVSVALGPKMVSASSTSIVGGSCVMER
ncbi:hypothetical protein [Pseudonocardia sp. Ae717_Ps2]|uniref:hypothetical protein n=1 Tax=Pseudonocardia sp. Ae717_Ps2 TaxID=1885573 RepID=UPI001E29316E|nr:hypothetical protein [Pseudonocardia sp. Ae717_Ps2]